MKRLSRIFALLALIAPPFLASGAEAKIVDERVFLIGAGNVDKPVLERLKESLPGSLPMSARVDIGRPLRIPAAAYDPARQQYNAQAIVDDAAGKFRLALTNERALVVVDVDLYMPGLNFVFGLADAKKGVGVISLARLRNEFYGLKPDNRLLFARALKEAVRELGHSWGLSHCPNKPCVMYSSNTLRETDGKRDTFCYNCRILLDKRGGETLSDIVKKKR